MNSTWECIEESGPPSNRTKPLTCCDHAVAESHMGKPTNNIQITPACGSRTRYSEVYTMTRRKAALGTRLLIGEIKVQGDLGHNQRNQGCNALRRAQIVFFVHTFIPLNHQLIWLWGQMNYRIVSCVLPVSLWD